MSGKIKVRHLNIFYRQEGKGKPLVLLHGWGKSKAIFYGLSRTLAKNFTVIALDLPGFGQSSLPPHSWGIEDYASLVVEFCQKLGWDQFFVLGHSFGGRIALQLAHNYPGSVKSLILTGVPILRRKKLKSLLFLILAKIGSFIFLLPPFFLTKTWFRRAFYYLVGELDYYQSKGIMKEVLKRVINQNQEKILTRIRVPTLIVWGENDQVTGVDQAWFLKEKIKNSTLRIISHTSHKLPYEKEKIFSQEIVSFLKKEADV